jgi:hypothetical protein
LSFFTKSNLGFAPRTHLNDPEGFIYYLSEIQKAIAAVKRLNEMYKLLEQ